MKKSKIVRRYLVNGVWRELGSVECAGNCGCLTYGPTDGRPVYCYLCPSPKKALSNE